MRLVDANTDIIYSCKYVISSLVFMMGDTNIQMSTSNILSVEKLDDFDFNLRTIIKVVLLPYTNALFYHIYSTTESSN